MYVVEATLQNGLSLFFTPAGEWSTYVENAQTFTTHDEAYDALREALVWTPDRYLLSVAWID